MKKNKNFFVLFIALAFVVGCATTQQGQQQQTNNTVFGTLLGAATGAMIGAATGHPGQGALMGAGAGMLLGASAPIAPENGRCPNGMVFFQGACFDPGHCQTTEYQSYTDEDGFHPACRQTTCQ